ncbi:MAG: hypothetical protein ACUVX8_06195 [Candidatus Zipacnadales bacterium]
MAHLPIARAIRSRKHPFYLLSGETFGEDAQRVRLRRGLLLIGLVGLFALSYLCFLVQVSELDVICYQLQSNRDEFNAAIGADKAELAGLIDRAVTSDQAERLGLRPPIARDRILVSPELCPYRQPLQSPKLGEGAAE